MVNSYSSLYNFLNGNFDFSDHLDFSSLELLNLNVLPNFFFDWNLNFPNNFIFYVHDSLDGNVNDSVCSYNFVNISWNLVLVFDSSLYWSFNINLVFNYIRLVNENLFVYISRNFFLDLSVNHYLLFNYLLNFLGNVNWFFYDSFFWNFYYSFIVNLLTYFNYLVFVIRLFNFPNKFSIYKSSHWFVNENSVFLLNNILNNFVLNNFLINISWFRNLSIFSWF